MIGNCTKMINKDIFLKKTAKLTFKSNHAKSHFLSAGASYAHLRKTLKVYLL